MSPTLSVIIVSYNVKHYLAQCLDSVWRSARSASIGVEVWVVDNASSDGSLAHLRSCFPAQAAGEVDGEMLHLVENRRNVGFGRANNQALAHCRGEYVLFLNPDTILTERTLNDCLEQARAVPRLGAMGVQMLHTNGRMAPESRRGLPTPWTAFCKMSGLGRLFPKSRLFGHYYMGHLARDRAAQIEIVSGAFMWCSHAALESCGGFDESFFMYGEDIDLSYRFLLGGFENWYVPTPILHYKGESTQKNSYRYVHVFYQAMLIFFRKHFPRSSRLLALPVGAAIVGQAVFTLLRQRLKALGQELFPDALRRPLSVCYVGAKASHSAALERAERWGIDLHCCEQAPERWREEIVAFSVEDFTYGQILEAFQRSEHRSHIGTYFPQNSLLILGNEVFA